jgi:ABC-2 type transport system permease protein
MNNPRGTYTLFKRETSRFLKIYLQTILSPVVSNLLYLAIFGISLQRSIPLEGLTYLQFLVPGLIIMGLINNAYQNPSSSIIQMKFMGLIYDVLTIPLKKIEIFIALIGAAILRAILVGIMTLITASFFVTFPYHSIPIIIFTALMVSVFFSSMGMLVGIWANNFDRLAFFQNFVLMPLIFLGGVFYPITRLPGIFAKISQINPIVYMIDLLRYGFTGIHEFSISLSLGMISVSTVLIAGLAYYLLKIGYRLQS